MGHTEQGGGLRPERTGRHAIGEGCTAAALANAMERLLAAKEIGVETFGSPSKQRQRLVVTPSNRLPTGN